MKKFYKNSKKYVLLSLLSMSLVLQSCKMERDQAIIPTVKQLPDIRLKIIQDDTENPGNHRHRSRPIEGMKFTGKREREKGKQETSLVQTQVKRKKLEWLEDENISSEDEEEIINTEGCSWQDESVDQQRRNTSSPMNLVTFFKAISESNKARTAIKEEAKRVRKEKGKEWKLEDDDEVLENIFQHLPFRSILNLTEVNTVLYKFFNDCQEVRLVGVERITQSTRFNPYTIDDYHYPDFINIKYAPENIPTIPFCRIMQQVLNLPRAYWPYITKTNISKIILAANGIKNTDLIDLWKYLQGSKVQEVNLSYNEITDEGANKISQLPLPASLSKVDLQYNELREEGKRILQSTYPNVAWVF